MLTLNAMEFGIRLFLSLVQQYDSRVFFCLGLEVMPNSNLVNGACSVWVDLWPEGLHRHAGLL